MSPIFGAPWPVRPNTFVSRRVLSIADFSAGAPGTLGNNVMVSTAWSANNRAIFWPIMVEQTMSVTALFLQNGVTASGNIDLGLYTPDGVRIVSTGSTAQSGTSTQQSIAVTATIIAPGLYYLACALSSTAGTVLATVFGGAVAARIAGALMMDTAFALPATATFATITTIVCPMMGLTGLILPSSGAEVIYPATVHTYHNLACGASLSARAGHLTGAASAVWPTANKAFYIPFILPSTITVTQLFSFNGTAVSGNIDVGIYTASGVRIVSAGSTAQATTNDIQLFNVADTELSPGPYFLAMALDNTTGTIFSQSNNGLAQQVGFQQQTTAFPLPATATFAAFSTGVIPVCGLSTQAVI